MILGGYAKGHYKCARHLSTRIMGLLDVLLTVFGSMLSVYSDCYCLQSANRIL